MCPNGELLRFSVLNEECNIFIFSSTYDPDILYSLPTRDMATEKIEASLLGVVTLGIQQLEEFDNPFPTDSPSVAFCSNVIKVKA